jgi:hypothetical protein
MRHTTVADVMSTSVISARPQQGVVSEACPVTVVRPALVAEPVPDIRFTTAVAARA